MIFLFFIDEICLVCRKVCLNIFGKHSIHCRELLRSNTDITLLGMSYLIYFDGLKCISMKKEMSVNFLTDPHKGRLILTITNILVCEWVEGKHTCVNLTNVSPLVGLRERRFCSWTDNTHSYLK